MPWRILLVEDDAMISALLAELLVECGHHVCGTAQTEAQAVVSAERLGPDLMIVDAQLQAGRGIAGMETILRRTAMPHVFITGGTRRIFPAGATVLLKPFGKESLIAALESVTAQPAAFPAADTPAGQPGARLITPPE
jgi:DNA-binding response OmpR family regulator